MTVTAAAYIGAAVIAASAAFIGVVIGKEQKTTEFRQDWINAQRSDLALVLALANNARGKKPGKQAEARVAFDEALNRIRLRENPTKEEWKSVLKTLDRLRNAAFSYSFEVDLTVDSSRVIALSQQLLKAEWTRVRAGETWFKIAKWMLPPMVLIVGLALAYGKGFIYLG
ncbi:hypothetical protein SAMN05444678_105233 [Sphingomonas sp. YR710]|uniref:hypothetical protein n=1 Tax=Sphingomonas sp. YR710 TaxID=1882773 RepID=UPI00088FE622|nr:hypothetical protein [Sphingomonas sp. YR710]SDC78582.1 hypothetical protein SAMN05444678_105233 [Sphingomonas sp. YR710]